VAVELSMPAACFAIVRRSTQLGAGQLTKRPTPWARTGLGADATVIVGRTLVLDGLSSYDPDEDPITYSWRLLSAPAGSAALLVDATTARPSLAPDVEGSYVIELVVNDGFADSATDTVQVVGVSVATAALACIARASAALEGLPTSAFDAPGHRSALLAQLASAARAVLAGDLVRARDLLDRVLIRVDGFPLRGAIDPKGPARPFAADFVVDAAAQAAVYADLQCALSAIAP
jgi:hypothetical protein